jgi:replicative superfamily II helicase
MEDISAKKNDMEVIVDSIPKTRDYQQEMLDASLKENIIIAQDTGSGKTLIAILRMRYEIERGSQKVRSGYERLYCTDVPRCHGLWRLQWLFAISSTA